MGHLSDSIVSLRHVEKWYGNNHVVKDMNLEIQEGEFLTLLGPSGCGKTTTLRMIAGFENATSGTIEVQGQRVEEKEPYERDVNTVFQNYSLFPHMTVFDNVAYGPSIRKVPKDEIKRRVTEMLALVQMSGYEKRKPDALSGGQKQRVAIARALINNPRVLLLDEPLGALDLKLRKQMQIELKRLQKKLGITFVYVTHDQEEAMTMSDRIAVMRDGVILQMDAPAKIYDRPNCRFVADFIGESNVISGVVRSVEGEKLSVETPGLRRGLYRGRKDLRLRPLRVSESFRHAGGGLYPSRKGEGLHLRRHRHQNGGGAEGRSGDQAVPLRAGRYAA